MNNILKGFFFLALIAQPVLSLESGPYFGASVGYDRFKLSGKGGNTEGVNGYLGDIYFGYNFVPYFALEVGHSYVQSSKEDDNKNKQTFTTHKVHLGPTMSGELTKNVDIFNKIHLSQIQLSSDEDDEYSPDFTGLYYELGLNFKMTDNVGITTNVSYTYGQSGDYGNYISYSLLTGLKFSF